MMAENAKKMKCVGMIAVFVQDPLIQAGRAIQVTCLVKPDGFMVWVEDFCRQNPSQKTAYVLAEYARLNNDKRVRKRP